MIYCRPADVNPRFTVVIAGIILNCYIICTQVYTISSIVISIIMGKITVDGLGGANKACDPKTICIVVGGIIPSNDYEFMIDAGCSAIFGPGTPIPDCAERILDVLEKDLP